MLRALARLLPAVALTLCAELLAAQEAPPPGERADPQRPGLPPPYYGYGFGPETTEHRTIAVEEAIALALAEASAFQEAQIDARIAELDVRQARAALLPQLGLQLGYIGTTPAPGVSPSVFSLAPANGIHEALALVTASGTLDVSGRLRAALHRNRELTAAAHAGSEAARRALVLATVDAYYGLSLARQKRRVADEILGLAESFAETARQLAGGGGGGDDLFRAQAEALRRRDELEAARAAESAATDALRTLTGIPINVHVGVSRPADLPPLDAFASYTESAVLATRPELAQLDALKGAAESDLRAARGEKLPQLSYALSGGFDATDLGNLKRFSGASAQLLVNVPLFNFGAIRSRETQAELRTRSAQLARRIEERQLQQEFYTARATAFSALARVRESKDRASAAETNLTALLARYRERKATITEVIDAQSAHADARDAYYQAITDYQTSRARLAPDPARLSFAPVASALASGARATPAACAAELAQAPELAGLRLGLPLEELRARFPGLAIPGADAAGGVHVEIEGARLAKPADDPAFAISQASLDFLDGRAAVVRVVFSGATTWETKDAFLAAAAARFGLPGPWSAFYDWSDKALADGEELRDLAAECHGFRLRLGLGLFSEGVKRVLSPHLKLEDSAAAAAWRARLAASAP
jgi:outer membrane protein TolC